MACASAGSFIMPNNVISMKIKSIYKISFRFVLRGVFRQFSHYRCSHICLVPDM